MGSGKFHLAHGTMARADDVDDIKPSAIKQYFLTASSSSSWIPLWIADDKNVKGPLCLLLGSKSAMAAAALLSARPITITSPSNSSSRQIFVSVTQDRLRHWESIDKMTEKECYLQQVAALVRSHAILFMGDKIWVGGKELTITSERESLAAIKATHTALHSQATSGDGPDVLTVATGMVGRHTLTINDIFVSKPIDTSRSRWASTVLGSGININWDSIADAVSDPSANQDAMDTEPTTAEKRAAAAAQDQDNFDTLWDMFEIPDKPEAALLSKAADRAAETLAPPPPMRSPTSRRTAVTHTLLAWAQLREAARSGMHLR